MIWRTVYGWEQLGYTVPTDAFSGAKTNDGRWLFEEAVVTPPCTENRTAEVVKVRGQEVPLSDFTVPN